ncbi:MAG: hypothetical protein HY526_04355 [Betaproteobacteria bacterium]|nr:hypothetical protein [Betaproteobacteria bacterium]
MGCGFRFACSADKEYLRLLVDEIRVEKKSVMLRGSHAALAHAVAETNPGTLGGVPRFAPNWLPDQGSNLGPADCLPRFISDLALSDSKVYLCLPWHKIGTVSAKAKL